MSATATPAMEIVKTYQCDPLNQTMPSSLQKTITVAGHFKYFYCLDTCDVWTADGWLVTAVQNDGQTHHLRKGDQCVIAKLPDDQVLHYTPNKKAAHWGL